MYTCPLQNSKKRKKVQVLDTQSHLRDQLCGKPGFISLIQSVHLPFPILRAKSMDDFRWAIEGILTHDPISTSISCKVVKTPNPSTFKYCPSHRTIRTPFPGPINDYYGTPAIGDEWWKSQYRWLDFRKNFGSLRPYFRSVQHLISEWFSGDC